MDALHNFGTISLATKDTAVYSESTLDMGAINSKFRNSVHTNVEGAPYIEFRPSADFASIDGLIPFVQDAATDGSFTTILTGPEITAPDKDQVIRLPLPATHRRYLRAGCTPKSSGTFTAVEVEAAIKFGEHT